MRNILCGAGPWRRIAMYMAGFVAVGLATFALGSAVQPASAQQGFGNLFGYQTQAQRKRVRKRRARRSRKRRREKKKEVATKAPTGPLLAVVSLGSQHVAVYSEDGLVARSRVSSGMRGYRTPTGVFSIIQRNRHHYSNIYRGASMPFMQRITWSGVAMHAGVVPGYPASHGCIRLPYSFARRLWGLTKMGTRVVVSPRDTKPFAISHSFLPTPKLYPAPDVVQVTQQAEAPATTGAIELASLDGATNVATTTDGNAQDAHKAAATATTLNPIEYAAVMKKRARVEKLATEKTVKVALETANATAKTARGAVDDVKEAAKALEEARAKVAKLSAEDQSDISDPAEREAAAKAKTAAEIDLRYAQRDLAHARAREAVATPAAFDAVQAWKDAVAADKAAKAKVKEAERRSKAVSVFVSKKEGRVFVRQDWKEVYEAPVTIRNDDRPIGTHVYVALGAERDGSALRWTAVTMPERGKVKKKSRKRRRGKRAKNEVPEPSPKPHQPETAAGALDRIELPPEARRLISELLWSGASLIVSDNARSHEMGTYTDFIVLTR